MRGYFDIGIEGTSKPMNLCGLWRTAHAFGASFVFTLGAAYARRKGERADTSMASGQMPLYEFPVLESSGLAAGCAPARRRKHAGAGSRSSLRGTRPARQGGRGRGERTLDSP